MKNRETSSGYDTRYQPGSSSDEVWINNDADSMAVDFGQFDANWLVSADNLFGHSGQPGNEPTAYYQEAV